jgi:hypothetical protein
MHKKEIRELLCSMLLGDGSLVKDPCRHRNTKNFIVHYSMSHSTKQQDYLKYKVNEIDKIFKKKNLERRCRLHSPYSVTLKSTDKTYYAQKAKLHWSKYFKFLYPRIYKDKNGKRTKTIKYLLNNISSDKHLFIFFGDDGCEVRSKGKHKDGTEYYRKPKLRLYINNFTQGEAQLLKQWFESKYNISPMINHSGIRNNKKPILNFSPEDSEKVFQHIKVYVKQIPSMRKKFWLSLERYN